MDKFAIPIRPPPCCDICARAALAAKREGKLGFVMCSSCAERARAERQAQEDAMPAADRDFLASLDRQLADAVTFLPPAMRASFHAQVGALIKLTGAIAQADRDELDGGGRSHISGDLQSWRSERDRIRQRTGG